MTFSEATQVLLAGQRVRRRTWRQGCELSLCPTALIKPLIMMSDGDLSHIYQAGSRDIFARDWETCTPRT